MRLCIVIVNYRTPGLVLDVLDSLEGQIEAGLDEIVVVDNASGDGSAERLERSVAARGLTRFCRVLRADRNAGFSAGSNVGIRAADANFYLLLSSDTLVRKGAVMELLTQMQAHPGIGIAGPRIEWPDGTPQVSCYRDYSPVSELLVAAKSSMLDTLLHSFQTSLPVPEEACEVPWLGFACVLIRREVIEKVGLLDEGYFMYFEDGDYCRAARAAGFRVHYFPSAHVVHLHAGASSVRSALADRARGKRRQRERPPRYVYASRTRYFRKGYGAVGLVAANALWYAGRSLAWSRELIGRKLIHARYKEWLDNWTDAFTLQQ
jgi:N-acetylglucosaminyl-diphospho-decaprenol L-rhamnosyltransferase